MIKEKDVRDLIEKKIEYYKTCHCRDCKTICEFAREILEDISNAN